MTKVIVGIFLGVLLTYFLYLIGSWLIERGRNLERKEKKSKGFTLLEVLIILAIVGVTAATIFTTIGGRETSDMDSEKSGSWECVARERGSRLTITCDK